MIVYNKLLMKYNLGVCYGSKFKFYKKNVENKLLY